ncbi:MAG: helix-turn-helix domain-containing protein [Actinomycetes bacterium]
MTTTTGIGPAEATLACIARSGVARVTVGDIAREAGVSRSTLYRVFPSKRALVDAAIAGEADRVVAVMCAAADAAPTFATAVAAMVTSGVHAIAASPALRAVREREPELLHPHLAFSGGDRFLALAADRLAVAFTRWTSDPVRVAEWTTRLVLCLVWFPHPPVDAHDPAAVLSLVTDFVAPGLAATPEFVPAPLRIPVEEDR